MVIHNKRMKRSPKFVYTKEQMIDDIKEVIQIVGGCIEWLNPKTYWTFTDIIFTDGKTAKWEYLPEKSLMQCILKMNGIFVYGFGSDQKI